MFLSFFCIASEYPLERYIMLFGGFAPPAAWQTAAVFFIVLRLTPHCGALHFYLWKSRTFQNLFYPAIYKVASGL